MLDLKQVSILVYNHLKNCLEPYGYKPIPKVVRLWDYDKRPIKFCLCINNFSVKYWSIDDTNHLCNAIGANFKYITD